MSDPPTPEERAAEIVAAFPGQQWVVDDYQIAANAIASAIRAAVEAEREACEAIATRQAKCRAKKGDDVAAVLTRAWPFVGPCLHGRDPFTRCEDEDQTEPPGPEGPCCDLDPVAAEIRARSRPEGARR